MSSECRVDVKWMSSRWGVDVEWTLILTRGCFAFVIWNKGVSNSTHCCSILQDQNTPVLDKILIYVIPLDYKSNFI